VAIVVIGFSSSVAAYTYTANDNTHYDYGYFYGSVYAYADVTKNENNGELKLRGGWAYQSLHHCVMRMALEFTPSTSGRTHCSAEMSLSYKLFAGTAYGGFSYLYIRLVLLDSSKNPLESIQIWSAGAYCIVGGQWFTTAGNPGISNSVYWQYSLQSGTTYYAAVEMYSEVYWGGYAMSSAGTLAVPTILSCDVSEISVYT
jgi:hypothetical protein